MAPRRLRDVHDLGGAGRCPDCGGLHRSRGWASCVLCDSRPAHACQTYTCDLCQALETLLTLSDLPDDDPLLRSSWETVARYPDDVYADWSERATAVLDGDV